MKICLTFVLLDCVITDHPLDAVETTDRLTHITASRAKGPSKRPPTSVNNHNNVSSFILTAIDFGQVPLI